MLNLRTFRPTSPPTYSVSDIFGVCVTATVVSAWTSVCGGRFSVLMLLICQAVFMAFYLAGSLVSAWRRISGGVRFDLPLRLVVGYLVVNTALFILAWVSPLGIIANFGIVLGILLGLFVAKKPVRGTGKEQLAGFWVLGIALVAATLWCQDSLHAVELRSHSVLYEPWFDSYYHAVHIRIFAASHGASSIEDFRLAGVPARLYHYAPYLTPALIKQAAGIPSYVAYAGILVPLGVFFTGLGAYLLFSSFWGGWAGLMACAGLLLIPDGAQQGIGSPFMSYHWITQISPGATFGLAVLALAWLFVLVGCVRGSFWQIGVGWLFGGCVVFYKAQFFIASALLLFLVPIVFLRTRRPFRYRALCAVAGLAVYVAAIVLTQEVPGLPLVRFDGSSTGRLIDLINNFTERGDFTTFIAEQIGEARPWIPNLVFGSVYLLLMTFGLLPPLLVLLLIRLRSRVLPLLWYFPVLLVGNFLLMALGLAFDNRGVATPEELPHRPFVVMYFAVMAWTGGVTGWTLLRSRRPGRVARIVVACVPVVLLAVPAYFGSGVQRIWAMRGASHLRIELGLHHAAEYIRDHSEAQDIFQDSNFDSNYIAAALSERRPYVEHMMVRVSYNAHLVDQRTAVVRELMQMRDPAAVKATAGKLGIRWFLLHPGHALGWAAAMANAPVFENEGYRVYRLN
jgi:hypothetical protein